MLVRFGNPAPVRQLGAQLERVDLGGAPTVTYVHIPTGDGGHTFDASVDPAELRSHLASIDPFDSDSWVTHRPDDEALIALLHPVHGKLANHVHRSVGPSWAWSDDADMQRLLSEWYGVPAGMPEDLEDTHHTLFGAPGVGPQGMAPQALKVNTGNDIQAGLLGGGQVGTTGQLTASSATTATDGGAAWTTNQWAGCRVYAGVSATQMVYGAVVSNTGTVLTVDRWNTVGSPGGAAGTTPSATGTYVIVGSGNPAAWFMGLTATATSPAGSDTSLVGEITTVGGGLIRKICPYAHTAGVASYTLTPVFTANGSDIVPVIIAAIGVFNSLVASNTTLTMLFHTLLGATATLNSVGDQLTVTETVSQ